MADLLWGVDRLVQDNPGSVVVSESDPQRRRLGFTVTWGLSTSHYTEETLWLAVTRLQATFDDCAMKLEIVLPTTSQRGRDICKLIQTQAGREKLAGMLQRGLIGPTPRPAPPPPRVPGPTQWARVLSPEV